ncbi:hypothetical protein KP509_29G036800 [Ceratopteris richardii]|uniref:Cation efflux protein transmembrane domain-containing protein n=1 Tax=Ceratopteris richardii TaxID=49495 RepID=A0A8T2R727_CERRI|nr:hypothetical protein KP509_29G036800 [Ceratopteris richardii]
MIKLLLRINAKLSRRSHPRYSLRDHASFEPFLPLSATSGDNFSGVRTISTWDEGNFRTVNDLRRSALTLHKWRHLNRYPVKIQAFHSQSSIESAAATAICSKTSFQSSHSGISKSFFKVGFINPCTRLGFKDGISRHCIFAVHCMPIRAHMGHAHDHHDHTHNDDTGEAGERVSRLGFLADIFLTVGKGCAGYVSGSTAVIADAAHSMSDVVLSGVALWIFKAARAPKDQMHPYGHGKFETLGALGISSMLLLTGGGIAWHAVEVLQGLLSATDVTNLSFHSDSEGGFFKLFRHEHGSHEHHTGHDIEHEGLALTATIISIGIKEGLYWITKKVGDARGSELLKANAWHHRSDAISSVIALLGVGGAMLGWRFLDPIAGILVSGLVLRAGLQTGYKRSLWIQLSQSLFFLLSKQQ